MEKRANAIYKELSEEEQKVSKLIFLELIELTELKYTKRQVSIKQLENLQALKPELLNQVIQKLVKANLVVTDKSKEQQVSVVNIAHEALIQHWEQLHHWAESYSDALIGIRNIEAAAKEWETNKKDKDYLLIGPKLATAEDNLNNYADKVSVSNLAQEFVQKSINYRWIKRYSFIAILTLVILILSWFGFYANIKQIEAEEQRIEADRQRDAAKLAHYKAEQSEQAAKEQAKINLIEKLGTQSILATKYPNASNGYYEHALLLAVQAFKEKDTGITRSNLLRVLQAKYKPHSFLYGHVNSIYALAFSPDGKILASVANDNMILLWNVDTGKLLDVLFYDSYSRYDSLAFSPDGQILASGSDDKTITFWDVETRKLLGEPFTAENGLTNLAFSPDGNILASSSSNGSNSKIQLWNVKTRTLQGELLSGHSLTTCMKYTHSDCNFISVAFSPDSKTIATAGSQDKAIWLWNVDTKKQIGKLSGYNYGINSVTFSPDGNMIAASGDKNIVILWDIDTKKQIISKQLSNHVSKINKVVFSPNGKTLTSISNYMVTLLDIYDKKQLKPIAGFFYRGILSPDGKTIASGSKDNAAIKLYDIKKTIGHLGKVLFSHHSENGVVISPDGKTLATNSYQIISLWDIETKQPLSEEPLGEVINRLVFSPDGKIIATMSRDKKVRLWDVKTRQPLGEKLYGCNTNTRCAFSLTFSPNGKILARSAVKEYVRLWDVETRQPLGEELLGEYYSKINKVFFSPDGKTVVAKSNNKVILWDIETRQLLGKLEFSSDHYNIIFSPNSKILVINDISHKEVILWDVETRQPLGKLEELKHYRHLIFSPDGKILVMGTYNNEVILWDVETRQQLGKLRHTHNILGTNIIFSPDGKTLVTEDKKNIILWDVKTRQVIGEPLLSNDFFVSDHFFPKNSFVANNIGFNPNGNLLIDTNNNTLILYEINQESLLKKACAIVNRNFSQKEWQKYMGNRLHEKTCPNLPKDTIGAIELIRESNKSIRYYEIEQAKSKIKKAHALDPNLHTGKIELIKAFIQKGKMLARQGKIKQAIDNYTEAQKYDYYQNISSSSWNTLCWFGSLYGYINEVKEACKKAVTLEPKNIWSRRSRGIYKALIGDIQGAILDFQFFVDATKNNNFKLQQRLIKAQPKKDNPFTMQLQEQRWLDILQQGKNPFTSEEIEKLKKLKFGFKKDLTD